jgi:hypothetical protein
MSTGISRSELARLYEESAQAYLRSLPLEHFRESTPQQARQQFEEERSRAEQAKRLVEETHEHLSQERQHRQSAEEDLARLRAELERLRGERPEAS